MIPTLQQGGLGRRHAAASGGGGGGSDPYWANVVSLLHFDGPDGSSTFTDEKGKSWTRSPNTIIDTAQSQFGGSSLRIPSGDEFLRATLDSADFEFGAGDFTIECWVLPDSLTGAGQFPAIAGKQHADSSQCEYLLYLNQNNSGLAFHYSQNGTTRSFASKTGALTLGQKHHVAVSRSGSDLRVFLDGVGGSVVNVAGVTLFAGTAPFIIGRHGLSQAGNAWVGWIDELRVTKGVGRYTGDFTPPTAAFPNS